MKYIETSQGNIKLFLWETGRKIPKGIEDGCIVLSKDNVLELKELLMDFE